MAINLARQAFEAWCNVPADYPDRQKWLDARWAECSDHTRESWARVAAAVLSPVAASTDESPFSPEDDFYFSRDHEAGAGCWCVVGPKGMRVVCQDKTLAAILGLLLSGKSAAAAKWANEVATSIRNGGENWYRST